MGDRGGSIFSHLGACESFKCFTVGLQEHLPSETGCGINSEKQLTKHLQSLPAAQVC